MNKIAKEIRTALKKEGITAKQVSVREENSHDSYSFAVTIRDGNISEAKVRDICKNFSCVYTDERTGEILDGGNTYITICRDNVRYPVDGSEYLDAVKAAIAKITADGKIIELCDGWTIFRDKVFYVCDNQKISEIDYSLGRISAPIWEGVAESIATAMKARKLDAEYLAQKQEKEIR